MYESGFHVFFWFLVAIVSLLPEFPTEKQAHTENQNHHSRPHRCFQVDTRGRACDWYAQPGVCATDGEFYTPSPRTRLQISSPLGLLGSKGEVIVSVGG